MTETTDTVRAPDPSFPPLFRGLAADKPFLRAIEIAKDGTDPGLITYNVRSDHMSAAIVLAPEAPLQDAVAMLLVAANGFGDAFGALAPSEVACQFDWPAGIRINGARCGGFRAAASHSDPEAEPDWLVIGIDIPVFARTDLEPGETPGETTLWEEGCAEIDPVRLLESWSRHILVWIHEWLASGFERIHRDWMGRAYDVGETVVIALPNGSREGVFTGLDERGGLLLKQGDDTVLVPLTDALERH